MNQSEKQTFLVKVQEIETKIQELKTWVEGLSCREETLFEHVVDNPILQPVREQETTTEVKPKVTRARLKDGSMTADMIALRLSRELGRPITRENVINVGKHIKANPQYYTKQHVSRYSADSVRTIMNLFRSFNQI